jgi:ferritin
MEFEQEIFKGKTFSSLLEDIYKNSKNKEKQIREMILQLKDMITEPGDAIMLVPLLQGYMEAGIKNDEALIKMAGIVQKAMNASSSSSDTSDFLTDRDKELLFEEIKNIDKEIPRLAN